jgi:hypothetical protein
MKIDEKLACPARGRGGYHNRQVKGPEMKPRYRAPARRSPTRIALRALRTVSTASGSK